MAADGGRAARGSSSSRTRSRSAAQLNIRLAELTDLVSELLLPVAQGDEQDRRGPGEVRPEPLSRRMASDASSCTSACRRPARPTCRRSSGSNRSALRRPGRAAARAPGAASTCGPAAVVRERAAGSSGGTPSAPRRLGRGSAEEVEAWPGTALISHEFFAGATAEQAARAVGRPRGGRGARRGHRPRHRSAWSPRAGRSSSRTARPPRSTTTPFARTEPAGRLGLGRRSTSPTCCAAGGRRARRPSGCTC